MIIIIIVIIHSYIQVSLDSCQLHQTLSTVEFVSAINKIDIASYAHNQVMYNNDYSY